MDQWGLVLPPTLEEVIKEAGLEDVEVYIAKRSNVVAQYIAMQPILDL